MQAINQQVAGQVFEANGRFALLLHHLQPEPDTQPVVYLRFAFITSGVEAHFFPAFLLDDWGNEIKSLELYSWVDEFAPQFPRAELFGFLVSDQETQLFLRELELFSRWPCYAYPAANAPAGEGALIEAILLPEDGIAEPVKIKRPSWVERPLRRALVQWWQVPPTLQNAAEVLT